MKERELLWAIFASDDTCLGNWSGSWSAATMCAIPGGRRMAFWHYLTRSDHGWLLVAPFYTWRAAMNFIVLESLHRRSVGTPSSGPTSPLYRQTPTTRPVPSTDPNNTGMCRSSLVILMCWLPILDWNAKTNSGSMPKRVAYTHHLTALRSSTVVPSSCLCPSQRCLDPESQCHAQRRKPVLRQLANR